MSDTPKNYESDTPETCEAVERWQQGKINIFDEMARLERERDEARKALQRLADCDWVITLPNRMDAVRKIARDALEAAK
jgi:hypothetical protein